MEITVIIPNLIAFHAVEPLLKKFSARGTKFYLIVYPNNLEVITEKYSAQAEAIYPLDTYLKKHAFAFKLARLVELAFTPQSYSPTYRLNLLRSYGIDPKKPRGKLFSAIRKFLPDWDRQVIDGRTHRFIGRFVRNVFPTQRILVVTFSPCTHLFCAPGLEVASFLESWDHPSKTPMGYLSSRVFMWNERLFEQWNEFHGHGRTLESYPVKLHYVIAANRLAKDALLERETGKVMYPATVSSLLNEQAFAEELEVIRQICEATRRAGKRLLIKPKPNGQVGDYDHFLKDYDHIEIGQYVDARGGSNYDLNDTYNAQRLAELEGCEMVINLHTTFAMDAAVYGLPVLQFVVEDNEHFPYFTEAMGRKHLQENYLKPQHLLYKMTPAASVESILDTFWQPGADRAKTREFAVYLRDWILPDRTLDEAMEAVADECLGEW